MQRLGLSLAVFKSFELLMNVNESDEASSRFEKSCKMDSVSPIELETSGPQKLMSSDTVVGFLNCIPFFKRGLCEVQSKFLLNLVVIKL